MDRWTGMRAELSLEPGLVYLDHAAVSPLPRACRRGMEVYLHELTRFGATRYPGVPREVLQKTRDLGARLLGTGPEHVFVVRSTTGGLAVAATGLPVREGDNVVLVEREFPANIRPWLPLRRRGVEVRFVPQRAGRVSMDDLADAVDRRTAAVSVSFVQFLSGFRLPVADVAALCRQHDALFVLDAIQGLGVLPLDVAADGVDFLSADAHKWMMGPEGVGLGYASSRALDRIEPAVEGWLSVERPFDFFDVEQPLRKDAARYEEGASNLVGVHGMNGSLELLLSLGTDALEGRLVALTDHLVEGLAARGWTVRSPRTHRAEKSGIVLASRKGMDPGALARTLAERNFVVSVRGGALRVSPHAYNTFEELDELLTVLDEATR